MYRQKKGGDKERMLYRLKKGGDKERMMYRLKKGGDKGTHTECVDMLYI